MLLSRGLLGRTVRHTKHKSSCVTKFYIILNLSLLQGALRIRNAFPHIILNLDAKDSDPNKNIELQFAKMMTHFNNICSYESKFM